MIKRARQEGAQDGVRALVEAIKATLGIRRPRASSGPAAGRPRRRSARGPHKIYRTVVTIDRAHFRLRLFKRLKFVAGYGVAVGSRPTRRRPACSRSRASRSTRPGPRRTRPGRASWRASRSRAAPDNPLKARWMGVAGRRIHGTGEPWSIGTRASHGCIRMTVPDVIELFRRVSIGTPVLIE